MPRFTSCSLRVLERTFAVVRLDARVEVPADLLEASAAGEFFACVRTPDELSIVCDEASVPADARVERGFACLGVVGPLAFELVGLLAELTRVLADEGIALFAISSFDTDYVLVRRVELARAVRALRAAGHRVDGE